MTPSLPTVTILILIGILFLATSLILGQKMTKNLPGAMQGSWKMLISLILFFLCGYLFFLPQLYSQIRLDKDTLAALIFCSGAIFVFLVINFTRMTIAEMQRGKRRLNEKNRLLAREITYRLKAEKEIRNQSELTVKSLFEVMDEVLANRDQYTFEHAMQVAEISKRIGIEMELADEDLKAIELGCLVHDIGKTAIPDDILLKPGRFDQQDRHIMEYHPLVGAKLFARHLKDDRITDIILNHHERLDGSGYPAGLKGEEIDLFPRIVAVADTYESLVAKRPYKRAMSIEKALAILDEEAAAGKIDATIVSHLKQIAPSIPDLQVDRNITAGFMQDVEVFRQRTYFREPLSDFYNYRYLYFLDDAKVLRKNSLPFDLILIHTPTFGALQQKVGHIVADQVLDELGQKLLKTSMNHGHSREQYEGSVMVFRKGTDYLIYAEFEGEKSLVALEEKIDVHLRITEDEWGLESRSTRQRFPAGYPLKKALSDLFGGPAGEH